MKRLIEFRLLVTEWLSKPYVKEIVIVLAVLALVLAASASDDYKHP